VAPFGASVHVVGSDRAALQRSIATAVRATGVVAEQGETSLEDVFIHMMRGAPDNTTRDHMQ